MIIRWNKFTSIKIVMTLHLIFMTDSSVGIVTRPQAGLSGFQIPAEVASRFSSPKQRDWFLVPPTLLLNELKENLVRNTTCSEQMVYSAIETTCFGLYWPSSGFCNIEEESIIAVKTVSGCCWFRDLYINSLTTLFLVQELFVNMEKKL